MKIKVTFFETGYCTNIEKITLKTGGWKIVQFPALVALINHPHWGGILFDTGYSEHFFTFTKRFPYSIYPKITPVYFQEEKSIKNQLIKKGVDPDSINYIFLSHLHADHIGGCLDFPNATFITSKKGYDHVKDKTGFRAVKEAFIPELLPQNFNERMQYIESFQRAGLEEKYHPFYEGYDLFEDGTIIAIDLTGHAIGQFGLLIKQEKDIFLIADAVWSSEAYRNNILPMSISRLLIADYPAFVKNVCNLYELSQRNKNIRIIPSHCWEIFCKEEM